MLQQPNIVPPMPEIGRPESYYAKLVKQAEIDGNHFARAAAKVGQYITAALAPGLDWAARTRYFDHSLHRHCIPPAEIEKDHSVSAFYRDLAELIRQHAGQEALRLASAEDDNYATRLGLGGDREPIEAEAEVFFSQLLGTGDKRPDWFNESDWMQLRMIRDQWM